MIQINLDAYVRVHTHVTAETIVGTTIIYDSADSLERKDGQTGVIRVREIFPLQKARISQTSSKFQPTSITSSR